MYLSRRKLLGGLGLLIAAPAIVKASSLMPVKAYASDVMPEIFAAEIGEVEITMHNRSTGLSSKLRAPMYEDGVIMIPQSGVVTAITYFKTVSTEQPVFWSAECEPGGSRFGLGIDMRLVAQPVVLR